MTTKLLGAGILTAGLMVAAPAFAQISVGIDAHTTAVPAIKGTTSVTVSNANAGASVTASSTVMATGADMTSFTLSRKDVSASSLNYVAPASVSSSGDLSAYVRSLITSDENVSKVSSTDDHVSVWYAEPAKFLGVVPMTVDIEATVDASGNVSVGYPWWYGMFVRDNSSTQLQSDLESTAGVIARGEGGATLSSSAKARLVNALYSIMKSRYESTFTATTSANVTSQ